MKYKVRDKTKNINVIMSLALNILFYILVIFMTLFTTSFNWSNLLPRWELWTWLPIAEQGFWPWQKGFVTIVEKGTPGSYWQPGVLIISGVIQILGYMFFINTKWGRKLKLTLEDVFLRNTRILSKFRYLISDDEFRENLKKIDLQNKKDTWRLHIQAKLQKHQDKMSKAVAQDIMNPVEHQKSRTKRWLDKEAKLKLQINDQWINENIYRIKIKYPRINVRMVVNGVTEVEVPRMAVTDVKSIESKENLYKLIYGILSFVLVSLFVALSFPAFRQDIWALIKDFVVYSVALIMNIIMGIVSANVIHDGRIRETEDRKGYIESYVGREMFKAIEREVDGETTKIKQVNLENELYRLQTTIKEE